MSTRNCHLDAARVLFAAIASDFPRLHAVLQEGPVPQVDLELHFAGQPGLPFEIVATLQHDELCLGVGEAFWAEWFPCSDSRVVDEFESTIRGVLSGRLRVVEFHRSGQTIKAQIQESVNGKWRPVATWSKLRLPSFSKPDIRVLQNKHEP